MNAGKGNRNSMVSTDEVIGKVFIVVGLDMRQCLICDAVFTRQGAAEHYRAVCHHRKGDSDHANR
jgi:hypothetical protein